MSRCVSVSWSKSRTVWLCSFLTYKYAVFHTCFQHPDIRFVDWRVWFVRRGYGVTSDVHTVCCVNTYKQLATDGTQFHLTAVWCTFSFDICVAKLQETAALNAAPSAVRNLGRPCECIANSPQCRRLVFVSSMHCSRIKGIGKRHAYRFCNNKTWNHCLPNKFPRVVCLFRKKVLLYRACCWLSSSPFFLWCMCQENPFQTAFLNHVLILRRGIGLSVCNSVMFS
jgi:hypothetical protein